MGGTLAITPESARVANLVLRAEVAALEAKNKLILSTFTEDRMPVECRHETKQREEKIAQLNPVISVLDAIAAS